MSIVIIKNNISSSIFLEELGCEIPGSGQRNLTDTFTAFDISTSLELKDYVSDEIFTVNDGVEDLSVDAGLQHISFETKYEDLDGVNIYSNGTYIGTFKDLNFYGMNLTDSTADIQLQVPPSEEVPPTLCQVRKGSNSTLNNTWTDIPFAITDVETDSEIIEHDTINTDRILIKETGAYEISLNTSVENSTTQSDYYRLRIDDTTIIPGSEFEVELYQGEIHGMSRNVYVNLTAGSFISLQMYAASAGTATLYENATLQVLSLKGKKGDKGDPGNDGNDGLPGTGSTINILKDSSLISPTISNLNFTGSATVTATSETTATVNILPAALIVQKDSSDISLNVTTLNFTGNTTVTQGASSSIINVAIPIFGANFQQSASETQNSTTSDNYQQKLRLTTTSLSSGTYRIGWYYEWQYSSKSYDFLSRIQINDTTTIAEQSQEPKDDNSDQWNPENGFYYYTGSGVLNIDLDYASSRNGYTAYIRRARLEIWRVS